jgi:hypothetical protein
MIKQLKITYKLNWNDFFNFILYSIEVISAIFGITKTPLWPDIWQIRNYVALYTADQELCGPQYGRSRTIWPSIRQIRNYTRIIKWRQGRKYIL